MRINIRRIGLLVLVLSIYVGCSDVRFDHKPSDTCKNFNESFGEGTCEEDPEGFNKYSYSMMVGAVSILVVDDNSGSMYSEQEKMADRFPNFIGSIANLDWELAITTTDVTKRGLEGTDGQFFDFSKWKRCDYS